MIFDTRITYPNPPGTQTVPDGKSQPNLFIPRSLPVSGKAASGVALVFISSTGAGNMDVTVYAKIESPDDLNAVEGFAATQEKLNEWVPVNSVTLTHNATFTNLLNLTPGAYYVRRTGGTAAEGGTLLGATI